MGENAEKTKFSIRVDTDLVALADTYIRSSTVKNRTELIENALRFYLGFLTAQKAEDYLLQTGPDGFQNRSGDFQTGAGDRVFP